MKLWAYWLGLRALARMGRHERWRCAMMSDPDISGEVYCHCDRCERDMLTYQSAGAPYPPTRSKRR